MNLRVVVVDDQPLARLRLRDLLAQIPDVECVGEAADGHSALAVLDELRPDLTFLDIQMPGLSGLEVLKRANPLPQVVFTTAYDQYAVTAFELHALDYLLKPFGLERVRVAVGRAREQLDREVRGQATQLDRAASALTDDAPLETVFVRKGGRIVPVSLAGIEHIEARGDYVRLCDAAHSSLLRATLSDFLARLDSRRFVRIHRSHAINLDRVLEFRSYDGRRLEVVLRSGKRLVASRSGTVELHARVEI